MTSRDEGNSGASRRRDTRVIVNREFQSMEEFIAEYVKDVSRSGVFVRTDDPLPVGTRVDLRFTVVSTNLETIEGTGAVVRIVAASDPLGAGMGVVFTDLTPASRIRLDEILARHLASLQAMR